jgi:hypothetical protein
VYIYEHSMLSLFHDGRYICQFGFSQAQYSDLLNLVLKKFPSYWSASSSMILADGNKIF